MPQVTSVNGKRIFIADGTTIGDYLVAAEHFDGEVTSLTDLRTMGWVATDVDTSGGATTVVGADGFLRITSGSKDDAGLELQLITLPAATATNSPHKSIGPITSTATLMDNRSLFFFTRIGVMHTVAAWTEKMLFGWVTTDTSVMVPGTGAPSITTGGGVYFHIGEDADISATTQTAAAAASQTSIGTQGIPSSATVIGDWVEYGFLVNFTDASAGTGTAYFYVDGVLKATKTDGLPMTSTQPYCVTYALLGGGTDQASSMGIDYMITGISAAGKTVS